jgi:dienelactone hydrolase
MKRCLTFALTLLVSVLDASLSRAQDDGVLDQVDCYADVGDPLPGTQDWQLADLNNQYCAWERQRVMLSNPAYWAAHATNAANGVTVAIADPLREPTTRWDGIRGQYERVTFTDPRGQEIVGYLFAPLEAPPGSLPGVLLMACNIGEFPQLGGMWWAAEVVAEHGYMVFCVDITAADAAVPRITGGEPYDDAVRGNDAADYLLSTPQAPNPNDPTGTEYNPMWQLVDRTRPLGFMGHSGGGSLALAAAHRDPKRRFGAVVAFDPSGAAGVPTDYFDKIHVPSMIQIADYDGSAGFLYPTPERPVAAPGSKRTYYDTIKAAGVDSMQVAFRSSTHVDWTAAITAAFGSSLFGEQTIAYYTLAWFDRYLAADPAVRADALRRLTAMDTFDGSSDPYSSGTGYFNPTASEPSVETPFADVPGNPEGGNVPLKIEGHRIRNHLSWWWPTRYSMRDDGGQTLECGDVRAATLTGACPLPEPSVLPALLAGITMLSFSHRARGCVGSARRTGSKSSRSGAQRMR